MQRIGSDYRFLGHQNLRLHKSMYEKASAHGGLCFPNPPPGLPPGPHWRLLNLHSPKSPTPAVLILNIPVRGLSLGCTGAVLGFQNGGQWWA